MEQLLELKAVAFEFNADFVRYLQQLHRTNRPGQLDGQEPQGRLMARRRANAHALEVTPGKPFAHDVG
jgi:hypothetical protein